MCLEIKLNQTRMNYEFFERQKLPHSILENFHLLTKKAVKVTRLHKYLSLVVERTAINSWNAVKTC